MLLYKPDKNAIEWKALTAACDELQTNPVAAARPCGAIPSTHDFHYQRFLAEAFPQGLAFPPSACWRRSELPLAKVRAFSIDDAHDDRDRRRILGARSAERPLRTRHPHRRAGARDSPRIAARRRGAGPPVHGLHARPQDHHAARRGGSRFTLGEGTPAPALSLYAEISADGSVIRHATRVNRVPITANLRLDDIGEQFTHDLPTPADPPRNAELRVLWKVAQKLSHPRQPDINRLDYNFYVDWDEGPTAASPIVPRMRGSPVDKLVSELMILVNNTWGKALSDARVPGLYRTQSGGKVKMSTRPGEHQGLGLAHYLWASSPLRRYSDLVNQRQLLAVLANEKAPYADGDAELFAALTDFEATYSQYAEFQDRIEHYWCLRWLVQEQISETMATVIRDNLVRFEQLPLVVRAADLPASRRGGRAGRHRAHRPPGGDDRMPLRRPRIEPRRDTGARRFAPRAGLQWQPDLTPRPLAAPLFIRPSANARRPPGGARSARVHRGGKARQRRRLRLRRSRAARRRDGAGPRRWRPVSMSAGMRLATVAGDRWAYGFAPYGLRDTTFTRSRPRW